MELDPIYYGNKQYEVEVTFPKGFNPKTLGDPQIVAARLHAIALSRISAPSFKGSEDFTIDSISQDSSKSDNLGTLAQKVSKTAPDHFPVFQQLYGLGYRTIEQLWTGPADISAQEEDDDDTASESSDDSQAPPPPPPLSPRPVQESHFSRMRRAAGEAFDSARASVSSWFRPKEQPPVREPVDEEEDDVPPLDLAAAAHVDEEHASPILARISVHSADDDESELPAPAMSRAAQIRILSRAFMSGEYNSHEVRELIQ